MQDAHIERRDGLCLGLVDQECHRLCVVVQRAVCLVVVVGAYLFVIFI